MNGIRLLLDENIPKKINKIIFPGHEVSSIRFLYLPFLIFISIFACATTCNNDNEKVSENMNAANNHNTMSHNIKITFNAQTFTATLFDNPSAKAFMDMLPLTIKMTELNGNEKYYDLSKNIPTNASNPVTIQNGDLMLYGSNTLVLFYKTFSTSYSYTKLGKIDNPTGLLSALGSSNITVTFEIQQE